MKTSIRLALAALLAACAPTTTAFADEGMTVDHIDHRHQFVRIGDSGVRPEVQHLRADDAFGWLNYSRRIARVSFDASVADHLVCNAPNRFRLAGDRLESPDIRFHQFASLCSLAPGEYTYRVDLRSGIGQGGDPVPIMREAKLIVEAG